MYEMVTGRVPFDADTPVSVALKQVQEEPVDPITYNKDLPISVNRIILKAMQKDPNLRYQNATEMIKDLNMALKKPNEDFVVLALKDDDSPTQKVPTIYELEMQKNNDRNARISDETEKNDKKEKGTIKEFFENHKFVKFLVIIVILAIIFIAVGLITMTVINKSRPEQAYIPQVVFEDSEEMLTEDEALELLEEAGFTNVTVVRESSETIEAGYVISIDPSKTDFLYNLDVEITLTVSSGPEIVVLPSQIIGENAEEIQEKLEKLGLTVNIVEETSETVEEGIVLNVDPEEGEEITKSTVVTLTVSSGSQYADITIVNVVGQTEENARNMLTALSSQLTVNVTYDQDSSKDDGVVLSQTVAEGKVIKENESITIVVNKLPTKSTIIFDINVASFQEEETSSSDDGENTTNTASSSTTKNVTVVIMVGGGKVNEKSVSSDSTSYTYSYTSTGSQEVRISVGGNEVYRETVDFSAGDKMITVSE